MNTAPVLPALEVRPGGRRVRELTHRGDRSLLHRGQRLEVIGMYHLRIVPESEPGLIALHLSQKLVEGVPTSIARSGDSTLPSAPAQSPAPPCHGGAVEDGGTRKRRGEVKYSN